METYHKIQTLFKRDLDGSLTGQKGKMIFGEWTTPELEYLADNKWEFTEKVDGTNIRIGWGYDAGSRYKTVKFGGRSDRAIIPEPLMRYLEETFTVTAFDDAFPNADSNEITLFGEGYGPGIQNGGLYRNDQSFVLFDVKVGPWWLLRKDVDDIADKLSIDSVPVLGYGSLDDAISWVAPKYRRAGSGAYRLGLTHPMRSTWGDFTAEGIVARPTVPMFSRGGARIITKIKEVDFR